MRWKAARPPGTRKKEKKLQLLTRAGKVQMHFASIYMLHNAHGKALFGRNWAHFGLFWPFYGSKKPRKADKKASKSPKNGVWRPVGPFEGHFYPFWIGV